MHNEVLAKYEVWFRTMYQTITKEMEKIEGSFEEYEWQSQNLGFILDEEMEDKNLEDYFALETAQGLLYQAAEHLEHIMKRNQ
ncbi:MAG: hypothetical protein HRT61_16420 [Ekhidna sp.]|nr:hypothetical protein [Ekhidna sp.]